MAAPCRSLLVPTLFRRLGRFCITSKKVVGDSRCAAPLWLVPRENSRSVNDHTAARVTAFQRRSTPWKMFLWPRSFSTESEFPYLECEYPPLPEYNLELKEKEVFIVCAKGLPWSCTAEDLLVFFSECKIRGGVNGIHMMQNRNGQPNGKAFIELEHKTDVQRALQKHMQYLGHRYVEVKEVTDADAASIVKASLQLPATDGVVKLRGLPYSCTVDDIIQFFEGLDTVEGGVTLIFDDQGRNTGIAYVEFASQEIANQALRKNRERIGNRYIELFPSKKSAIESHQRYALPDHWISNHGECSPESLSDSDAESSPQAPAELPVNDGVVKIQGLPYSATEEDVIQFFAGLDIDKDEVSLIFDKRGRSTGIAYVEFKSQEMADLALEKHREMMGNRYIEVFRSRKSAIRFRYSSRATVSPVLRVEKNTYQAAQSLPESSNIAGASESNEIHSTTQHCVHMRGLPFEATGKDIVSFFSPLPLAKIFIEYGPNGRASGEADVFFTCHEDAVSAMSRDKAFINERYIELFLNSTTARS